MPAPPLSPDGAIESSGTYVYDQVSGASVTSFPSAVFMFAARCTTSPVRMTSSFITMSIVRTGFALTVYVLETFAASAWAVIVARPGVLPVTLPHLSTDATAGLELVHVDL